MDDNRVYKENGRRGAPAIGCAAAFGYVLGVRSLVKELNVENMSSDSCSSLVTKGKGKIFYSLKTRATAVNLEWALADAKRRL